MVVFFDIDGTLVDDRTHILPQSAVEAVAKLRENGHIPVVNTGRPYAHIDSRVRDMAFAGWICGCGMEIRYEDQWIYRTAPDADLCRLTRDTVRDCGMQVLYEAADRAILTDGEYSVHPGGLRELQRLEADGTEIRPLGEEPEFLKFITFDWPGCRHEEFKERLAPWYTCIERGRGLLEVMPKACSKADGMARLLARVGRADTLAIGDSTNDLPMFRHADHTVCMGGGMEEAKAAAEYVTGTVLEDGIRQALQHFGLI